MGRQRGELASRVDRPHPARRPRSAGPARDDAGAQGVPRRAPRYAGLPLDDGDPARRDAARAPQDWLDLRALRSDRKPLLEIGPRYHLWTREFSARNHLAQRVGVGLQDQDRQLDPQSRHPALLPPRSARGVHVQQGSRLQAARGWLQATRRRRQSQRRRDRRRVGRGGAVLAMDQKFLDRKTRLHDSEAARAP